MPSSHLHSFSWGPHSHLPTPKFPHPVTDQIQSLVLSNQHSIYFPEPRVTTSLHQRPQGTPAPSPSFSIHSLHGKVSALPKIPMTSCHPFSILLYCPQDNCRLLRPFIILPTSPVTQNNTPSHLAILLPFPGNALLPASLASSDSSFKS